MAVIWSSLSVHQLSITSVYVLVYHWSNTKILAAAVNFGVHRDYTPELHFSVEIHKLFYVNTVKHHTLNRKRPQ